MAYNSGSTVLYPIPQTQKSSQLPNVGQLASGIGSLQSIANNNTAASAKEAEKLRDWQEQQAKLTRDFNSAEASKNRDWQERMSNTAHQREVRDLIAAGLNPVLSAYGGSGSAVTSGATASSSSPSGAAGNVDTSVTSAVMGLMSSFLSSMMSLENARVSAQSNQAIADKYTAMSKYTSELQSKTQLDAARISAMAQKYASDQSASSQKYTADSHLAGTKYASDQSAAAQKVSASIHAAAQKYGYDVSAMTQRDIAAFNAQVNRDLQAAGFKHEFDLRDTYPTTNQIFGQSLDEFLDGLDSFAEKSPFGSSIFDFLKKLF